MFEGKAGRKAKLILLVNCLVAVPATSYHTHIFLNLKLPRPPKATTQNNSCDLNLKFARLL